MRRAATTPRATGGARARQGYGAAVLVVALSASLAGAAFGRVDVGAHVASSSADLFGRHVVGRADRRRQSKPGEPSRSFVECDSEIEQFDPAFLGDEQVLRLQIAVHDPIGVQVDEDFGDLPRDVEGAGRRQSLFGQHDGAQGPTVDELPWGCRRGCAWAAEKP
jgi:hypothetical protein